MMRSTRVMLGIALGLGAALLSLTPYVSLLEEKIGLGLLFALRGEQRPPADVVIVNIDQESENRLSALGNPGQWPRRLHADLIRRLHAAGAELIGFNIFFSSPQPQDDDEMAAAMRESGLVVLASYLKLRHLQGDVYVESLEEPPAALTQSALATAPFLLAQGEEADRFLTHYGENGERSTFPTTLFRFFAIKKLGGELDALLRESAATPLGNMSSSAPPPNRAQSFAEMVNLFERQPENRDRLLQRLREQPLPANQQASLRSLIETLSSGSPRYFNHYGPVGTILRIPYHRLLAEGQALPDLRGKLVLVGFDEDFQADKSEGVFYSPFSEVSPLDLAATAIANLLNHDDIQPAFGRWGQSAWLFLWGCLLGWLSLRSLRVGISGIALLSAGYLAAACWLFSTQWLWLPVFLPLLGLAPLGMVGCLIDNYLLRSREHRKIHSLISRFIPAEAASQIENTQNGDGWEGKLSFGVCLATDAGQYTALAERMKPMDLGELMNDYYATLFPPVRRNGGWVSDVTGDAMMAVWTSSEHRQTEIRTGALRAALDILRAVDGFQAKAQVKLPIRMGLHCGEMRVGFVGGSEHGAYRAVGDTVNTSARLEGLNKLLGTRILVSQALIDGLAGFVSRPVGRFMLAGKSHPVIVHELLAPAEESTSALLAMVARFAEALALFQAAQWQDAALAFERLADEFPEDGPIRFYTATARFNLANPQATPELATISVSKPPPGALAQLGSQPRES